MNPCLSLEMLRTNGSIVGIFGAGGHGREIAWLATALGIGRELLRFVVDPQYYEGGAIDGISITRTIEFSRDYPGAPVFVAIGEPSKRRTIVARLQALGHSFPALVSSHAVLSASARWHEGVVIFPGTSVTVNVSLHAHTHINLNCSVSHDVEIGPFTSLSPGVTVCGHVRIGSEVFVGAKACIINGALGKPMTIGDRALIAAGACVTEHIQSGTRVAGVPARIF